MAARSKFTDEVRATILANLRTGMPRKFAAEGAGISEQTFHGWLRRAGDAHLDPDGEYQAFADDVMRATGAVAGTWYGIARKQATGTVCKECGGSDGNPKMTQFLLERLYPSEFGQQISVKVKQALEGEVELVMERIHAAFAREPELLVRILAAISGEADDSEGVTAH